MILKLFPAFLSLNFSLYFFYKFNVLSRVNSAVTLVLKMRTICKAINMLENEHNANATCAYVPLPPRETLDECRELQTPANSMLLRTTPDAYMASHYSLRVPMGYEPH